MDRREVDDSPGELNEDTSHGVSDGSSQNPDKGVTREELLEQLENQVNYFESLPQHEKFSFAINADVYYFMLIILNILKKG